MSAESTVFTTLRDDAGVGAVCADRIYPLKLPQGATLPAVTYQRITADHGGSLGGDTSNCDRVYMQINCWASTFGSALALADAVRAAFQASSAKTMPIDTTQDYDDDVAMYRYILDYYIWD